jgi:YfiH family protein
MLTRKTSSTGVVYYSSPLLEQTGVPHAFSTRLGGISPKPFDSLNLGNPNGCEIQDDYDRIGMNYQLLQEAIGCGDRKLFRVHQVHGNGVVMIHPHDAVSDSIKSDAIVTLDPDRMLSVRVADCVPILIASRDGTCVAAIHAGWRGVIARIVSSAIASMLASLPGTKANHFVAAIGPCIGGEVYEVGEEVMNAFREAFADKAPIRAGSNGKGFVDLRAAIRLQLVDMGLDEGRIDTADRCTFRDADEFFSHRRDNGLTGRMAALIGCCR